MSIVSRVTGTRRRPAQPSPRDREPAADGRSTRWDGHKARRRTEMLDAALSVIEENGTEISVQQIADRLRVPRPVVYRHFDGRADLDDAIRRHIVESLMAELLPRLQPEGTVRELVRGAVGTYVGWVERHPNLHRFLAAADPHGESATVLAGARDRIGGRIGRPVRRHPAALRYRPEPGPAHGLRHRRLRRRGGQQLARGAHAELRASRGHPHRIGAFLLEGNARSLDVPLTRDTVVADLYSRTEAARV